MPAYLNNTPLQPVMFSSVSAAELYEWVGRWGASKPVPDCQILVAIHFKHCGFNMMPVIRVDLSRTADGKKVEHLICLVGDSLDFRLQIAGGRIPWSESIITPDIVAEVYPCASLADQMSVEAVLQRALACSPPVRAVDATSDAVRHFLRFFANADTRPIIDELANTAPGPWIQRFFEPFATVANLEALDHKFEAFDLEGPLTALCGGSFGYLPPLDEGEEDELAAAALLPRISAGLAASGRCVVEIGDYGDTLLVAVVLRSELQALEAAAAAVGLLITRHDSC